MNDITTSIIPLPNTLACNPINIITQKFEWIFFIIIAFYFKI